MASRFDSHLEVRTTDEYEREFKRLKQQGKETRDLLAVVEILASEDALPPAYQDHALHGEWASHRECHIEGNWLLIYKVEGSTLTLVRTGTHTELFRSWR